MWRPSTLAGSAHGVPVLSRDRLTRGRLRTRHVVWGRSCVSEGGAERLSCLPGSADTFALVRCLGCKTQKSSTDDRFRTRGESIPHARPHARMSDFAAIFVGNARD